MSRTLTGVAASTILLVASAPATVHAAPENTVTRSADGDLAVGLPLTGAGTTITFPGSRAETGLRIPAPDGLTPVSIRGRMSIPSYASRATVDVRQGDRLLTRTVLPPTSPSDVTLALTGLTVDRQSRSAAVVISTHLNSDGFCSEDPDDAVRLTDTQVVYDGAERRPGTVGEFLPPMLAALTITVPDDVQPVEAEAAVGLATAVAARYGSAPVTIRTVSRPRSALQPEPPAPLTRQVVISTDLPTGLRLQSGGDYLTIGGPAADLAAQTAFLTADLSPLAMSPGVIAGQLDDAPQLARDVTTLADLGVGDLRVTTDGWPRLTIGIDQSRLARPSKNIRVQLRGTYTPPRGAGGRIVASVGDRVLDSVPTDASGIVDHWVTIPDDLLARYTALTVTAEFGGARTACGQADLATLTIGADGEVRADAADPPVPAGLQSLPQALMPRVQLAWTTGGAADVARAVDVLTHLQQLSAVRVGVDMVSVADAAASTHPAVIIAADGTGVPDDLVLPFASAGAKLTVTDPMTGRSRSFTADPAVRHGSVQVASNNGRTVVVATSAGDASRLDDLLAWLSAEPGRWSSAAGDAVVKAADAEPVFVTATATEQAAEADNGRTSAIIAIVAVIAVAAAVGLVVLRRRASRRRGR